MLHDEKMRNPSTYKVNRQFLQLLQDPDDEEMEEISSPEKEDFKVWRLLPHLQHLPDKMLQQLPLSAIFQLNAALAKEDKSKAKPPLWSGSAGHVLDHRPAPTGRAVG